MKTIVMSYKVIVVLCLLGAGILMAGSMFILLQDSGKTVSGSQVGVNNGILQARIVPPALDHINITLVLLCSGLIGFFGVRRQKNALNDYMKIKAPKEFDEELFGEVSLKRQNFQEEATDKDQCEIGKTCLV